MGKAGCVYSPRRHGGHGGFLIRDGTVDPENTDNSMVDPFPDALRIPGPSVPPW